MVKDLRYPENAYARAKEKLESKFGGERRIQLKHLMTLRAWRKLRPRNLEDMEEFLAVLDRDLVSMRDCGLEGELNGQSLNLTEKLSGEDVQTYKYWCFERQEEDNFESLVRWLEMRVQIMDEAWEETGEYVNRRTNRPEEQRRFNKGLPYDKKRKEVYC